MFSKIIEERLYLEYGPTNLVVEAFHKDKQKIYNYIIENIGEMLSQLSLELAKLRENTKENTRFKSEIAKKMNDSTKIFLPRFITPLASVAGAISEILLDKVLSKFNLKKIYINNGGDVAIFLKKKQTLKLLVATTNNFLITLEGDGCKYGVATSGWKGRSFSMGIADSVTTIARSSSIADAAATIIANDTNIENHKNIKKQKANEIDEYSDLKNKLITTSVGELSENDIKQALKKGTITAKKLIEKKIILTALLNVKENYVYVGKKFGIEQTNKKINFIKL